MGVIVCYQTCQKWHKHSTKTSHLVQFEADSHSSFICTSTKWDDSQQITQICGMQWQQAMLELLGDEKINTTELWINVSTFSKMPDGWLTWVAWDWMKWVGGIQEVKFTHLHTFVMNLSGHLSQLHFRGTQKDLAVQNFPWGSVLFYKITPKLDTFFLNDCLGVESFDELLNIAENRLVL